jgi:hypothetical protein
LQDSKASDAKTLQSQNSQNTKIRILLSALRVIHGRRCRYPGEAAPAYGDGYQPPASAPNFRGNVVRPVRGNNGAISCSNPNYTWQDGACKPYRGPRRGPW